MPHPRRVRCLLPGCCLTNDAEWSSNPSNIISTTVAGTTTITVHPRPVFTKPTIYSSSEKKTAVINMFNYNELLWKEWTSASMALHQAMINSIGAFNLATIERLSGHAGTLSLSCRELLGHITAMFGSLHAGDVFYIENHIKEELTSFAGCLPRFHQSKFTQLRHFHKDPAPYQRHHQNPLVRKLVAAMPSVRYTHRY